MQINSAINSRWTYYSYHWTLHCLGFERYFVYRAIAFFGIKRKHWINTLLCGPTIWPSSLFPLHQGRKPCNTIMKTQQHGPTILHLRNGSGSRQSLFLLSLFSEFHCSFSLSRHYQLLRDQDLVLCPFPGWGERWVRKERKTLPKDSRRDISPPSPTFSLLSRSTVERNLYHSCLTPKTGMTGIILGQDWRETVQGCKCSFLHYT